MTTIKDDELRQIAMQALRAKTKHCRRRYLGDRTEVGRQALAFPKLTLRYSSKFAPTYYAAVEKFLETWEVRLLNDVYKAGFEPPTEEQLEGLFDSHVRRNVVPGARYGLSEGSILHLCAKRAQRALLGWTPDYIQRMVEAGRHGGARSKRPTPQWRLDWLRERPEVGATAAAKELEVSRQHVYKLRKKLKAQDLEAELDELFGPPPTPVRVEEPPKPLLLLDDQGAFEALPVDPPQRATVEDLTTAQPFEALSPTSALAGPSWTDTWVEDRARRLALQEAVCISALDDLLLSPRDDDTPEPLADTVDLFEDWRREHPARELDDTDDFFAEAFADMESHFKARAKVETRRPRYRDAPVEAPVDHFEEWRREHPAREPDETDEVFAEALAAMESQSWAVGER